jgi:predicted alpha/beta superfamily hydrolase
LVDESIPSQCLGANRAIHIYLPPSYDRDPGRRYPVLYLHDGQNVFSSAGTNIAFGWGSWALDKTVDRLGREKRMQEIILVAVDHSAARFEEYGGRMNPLPAQDLTNSPPTNDSTAFENYAAFLITELKPRIDRAYRTRPDPADTGVMGSSLGGLCSLVLAWEHPEVFGCAASLSGSFQVEQTNFLNAVLRGYHGKPKPVRIYLDSGVMDFSGGDDGCALTGQAAVELERIDGTNSVLHFVDLRPMDLTELAASGLRRDKWAEARSNQHNEFYWRSRSWRALVFLFPTGG